MPTKIDDMIEEETFQANHSDVLKRWRSIDKIVDEKNSVKRGD